MACNNAAGFVMHQRVMRNVLIVDDDTDLLMLLKRALGRLNYKVTTLSDAGLVEQHIDSSKPAVIILDINLGDWDGRSICRQLKQVAAYSHIIIILYSALVDESLTFATAQADMFLQKPLAAELLATKIESLFVS